MRVVDFTVSPGKGRNRRVPRTRAQPPGQRFAERQEMPGRYKHLGGDLMFVSPNGSRMDPKGLFQGSTCFLCVNGPSLRSFDLAKLDQPGIVKASLNNGWASVHPHVWCCVDPPHRFCYQGWLDPTIMKLVPEQCQNCNLAENRGAAGWKKRRETPKDCPNVWFYPRGSGFNHATYLKEPWVSWGNNDKGVCSVGERGVRSVMLAMMRLLCSMSFKRICVVGADFLMVEGAERNYAFKEDRPGNTVRYNNRLFDVVNKRLKAVYPKMVEAGIEVFNCGGQESHLHAFPRMSFDDAVADATAECASPMLTHGHYSKKPWNKKKGRRNR